MIITHTKVSGLTNPVDTSLVGGEDWDDSHVISGPHVYTATSIQTGTDGAITWQASDDFADIPELTKTGTGTYECTTLPATLVGNVIATCSDGTGTPYQVDAQVTAGTLSVLTMTMAGADVNVDDAVISITIIAIGYTA